jgi:hypothetical protein
MRFLLAAALLAVSISHARAETVEVRPKAPVATLAVPDDWIATPSPRGIQIRTEDEEVYIWAETYKPHELETIVAEHNAYWREQGVNITGRDLSQHTENGVSWQVVSQNATYNGDPTVLMYMEFDLGLPSKSNILITYWASPEGHKEYEDEVGKLIKSMAVTEK